MSLRNLVGLVPIGSGLLEVSDDDRLGGLESRSPVRKVRKTGHSEDVSGSYE